MPNDAGTLPKGLSHGYGSSARAKFVCVEELWIGDSVLTASGDAERIKFICRRSRPREKTARLDNAVPYVAYYHLSRINGRQELASHICSAPDCEAPVRSRLTDAPLGDMLDRFKKSDKIGCFIAIHPPSVHLAEFDDRSVVQGLRSSQESSAADFLAKAASAHIEVKSFRDGFFPEQGDAIKSWFESLKHRVNPDLILTHRRDDAHQDHRHVCGLTWTTFRDHCILEYEVPKWDGDIGQPNLYMPISTNALERKIELLVSHFGSQRAKQWFDAETFRSLARLRGMECRAQERYAEAFVARKLALAR
jgi:LmbE family N-acetylglucosaminyl deacetylase